MKPETRILSLLLLLATSVPMAAADELPAAAEVLALARQAMGGDAIDRIESLSVTADCTSPRGDFVTEVDSGKGGEVLFRQRLASGQSATRIVAGDVGWAHSPGSDYQLLDEASRAMVRGHDFHLQVLAPEARYTDPRVVGAADFAGQPTFEIELSDETGRPISIFYRRDDHLPAGMSFEPPGEDPETITVVYDDWRTVDGVRLFGSFVLTHGEDRFTYDYTRIDVNAVDPAVFEMPAEVEALISAGGQAVQ